MLCVAIRMEYFFDGMPAPAPISEMMPTSQSFSHVPQLILAGFYRKRRSGIQTLVDGMANTSPTTSRKS